MANAFWCKGKFYVFDKSSSLNFTVIYDPAYNLLSAPIGTNILIKCLSFFRRPYKQFYSEYMFVELLVPRILMESPLLLKFSLRGLLTTHGTYLQFLNIHNSFTN